MLEDLRKYQKSRLGKIDAIAETIADQIQQKHQEREECDDEYLISSPNFTIAKNEAT